MNATPFRVCITDPIFNSKTYIVRQPGPGLSYISSDGTPLALSNLLGDEATETRFKLEDASDALQAAQILRSTLTKQWARNPTKTPQVRALV
jgi:hypothetical protein